MAEEIERKYLLRAGFDPAAAAEGVRICQGYLAASDSLAVRVRIAGYRAWLTVKGAGDGLSRPEFEYPIPPEDGREMLAELCAGPLIDKTRYRIPHAGLIWEVDVFHGANAGLAVAEVELERADDSPTLPEWVGQEVTRIPRYFNSALAQRPYSEWTEEERRGE